MLSLLSSTLSRWSTSTTEPEPEPAVPEPRVEQEVQEEFDITKSTLPPFQHGYPHWINGNKPESWEEPVPDMTISRLYIHPIKSCRGTSVPEVRYTPEGLEYDRIFMVIDATTNKCLTAREAPLLVVVYPQIYPRSSDPHGGYMTVSFPPESGYDSFDVPLCPNEEVLKSWTLLPHLQIWSSDVDGYICQTLTSEPDTPSTTLSKFLGRSVHLILKGPRPRRMGRTTTHPSIPGDVIFQDGFPLLVTSEESLEDVQTKVKECANGERDWRIGMMDQERWKDETVLMERFRPNVVVSGASQPFAEDLWQDIEVFDPADSSAPTKRMSMLSRCMRCQLPNVDTKTGIPDPAIPYKVIMKYRNVQNGLKFKPAFGVNAISRDSGVYRVGEKVRVVTCFDREVLPPAKYA